VLVNLTSATPNPRRSTRTSRGATSS
jgi:hypothetical protein